VNVTFHTITGLLASLMSVLLRIKREHIELYSKPPRYHVTHVTHVTPAIPGTFVFSHNRVLLENSHVHGNHPSNHRDNRDFP
jgi:hypothetical protein